MLRWARQATFQPNRNSDYKQGSGSVEFNRTLRGAFPEDLKLSYRIRSRTMPFRGRLSSGFGVFFCTSPATRLFHEKLVVGLLATNKRKNTNLEYQKRDVMIEMRITFALRKLEDRQCSF